MKIKLFAAFLLIISTILMSGQLSITSLNTDFTIDFNTYDGSTLSPTSTGINSNSWSIIGLSGGDVDFGGTGDASDFQGIDSDGTAGGGIYAFEVSTGDFSLGVQPTGDDFTPGSFRLLLVNNTGSTIENISVSYDIVLLNNAGRSSSFNFSHSGDNFTFTDIGSLDFTTPEVADVTPTWNNNPQGTTITGVSIANGENYYFKWSSADVGGSGSRDEFALNNVVINASAIPEPSTYALIFGGLALAVVLLKRRRAA